MNSPILFGLDDVKKIIVDPGDSMRHALAVIARSGLQLCMCVDVDGRLLGIIADSDIRRALLSGLDMATTVASIMNTLPVTTKAACTQAEAGIEMAQRGYLHLPIVDKDGQLNGLFVCSSIIAPQPIENFLVIMAGGQGMRLRPLTESTPKPMLPIGGKPILEHIVIKARGEGFKNIIITVNYLSDVIKGYFGDGSEFSVNIQYAEEREPLGTAGSISLVNRDLLENACCVVNGDVLTRASYVDMLRDLLDQKAHGSMAVRLYEWQNPYGVIEADGSRLVGFQEKPIYKSYINAGMYCLSPGMVGMLRPEAYCDMPELFIQAIARGMITNIYPIHETWVDIGRPEDYETYASRGFLF